MDHYSLVSNRLPDEFWEEVFGCIDQIQENPKRYPVQPNGLRRCNLKQFPYNILYLERSDRIRVQVVRHNQRRSDFGTRRKRI